MGNLLSACLKPSTSQEEEERRKQQQLQYQQQQQYQQQFPQPQIQQPYNQQNQQQTYDHQYQQQPYNQQYQQQPQQQYPAHQSQNAPHNGYSQQTGPPPWQGPPPSSYAPAPAAYAAPPASYPAAPYSYAAAAAHAGSGQGPVAAVARDLLQFETTGQVPEGLSRSVKAAKGTQALWFKKLLEAWKARWPPPGTPADLATFIRSNLSTVPGKELHGLLGFYDLLNIAPDSQPAPVPHFPPPVSHAPPPNAAHLPPGVQYEFHTMPVDAKAIADGDTVTVYVDVSHDPREAAVVPPAVRTSVDARQRARAVRDFQTADRLQREIGDAGYRVFDDGGVLAKKYRIRARGIDAPESKQRYGPESGAAFRALVEGRSLRVLIYTTDQYGRSVADMYCGNVFVQEYMLRNGHAWHYSTYDHRPEFAQWMAEARQARRGLWADPSVQEPWIWRKEHPRAGR